MHKLKKFLLTFLFLLLFCDASFADSPQCQNPIDFMAFRAYALKHSPLVAEIDLNFSNEVSRSIQGEVLLNPEIQVEQTFTSMRINGDNDPQTTISINQPIRLSDFGSRSQVSGLIRKASNQQQKLSLFKLNSKLKSHYFNLVLHSQILKLLKNAEARIKETLALLSRGVKKGLVSEGEEYLMKAELFKLQALRLDLEAETSALQAQTLELSGLACTLEVKPMMVRDSLPNETELYDIAKTSELSEASRFEILENLSESQTKLAELGSYPSLSPRFIYQHTNDGGDFFGAGITIPLPFWDRNQAEIIKAKAYTKKVRADKTMFDEKGLKHQIKNLKASIDYLERQLKVYSEKVIPSYEKALESHRELYERGRMQPGSIWQIYQTLLQAEMTEAHLTLKTFHARQNLSILIGEEL